MTRGVGGGGDYYSREATILNISIKGGGDYSREAINRGTAILQGNTVVSSLMYISSIICKVQCLRKRG